MTNYFKITMINYKLFNYILKHIISSIIKIFSLQNDVPTSLSSKWKLIHWRLCTPFISHQMHRRTFLANNFPQNVLALLGKQRDANVESATNAVFGEFIWYPLS
uniref:Uncharacterized protein n=1 Tax=Heterorhabditis bacteriophora TaxID=37862 RepID=A0A1I7WKI7_HETBA